MRLEGPGSVCGRYTRFAATELIYRHFGIPMPRPEPPTTELAPSWNVAPGTVQPVIRLSSETGKREFALMQWGLVPFFAEGPTPYYVNARAESLLEKPVFREPFRRRRCLVPINSFYEWKPPKVKGKKRVPWAIGLKTDEPFGLGGIWDVWKSPDGVRLESYAVVTTEPNEMLRFIHNRMPLIIGERDWDRWLTPGDPQHPPVELLNPYPQELMKIWRVKRDVGSTKNDRPDLIEPIEGEDEDEEPPQLSLFD